MKKILVLLLISFIIKIYPQSSQIKNFFNDLITDQENIIAYVHPDALKKANRLGIMYENTANKFLISFDIDESIREKINKGELTYQLMEEKLEDDFIKVTLKINENTYSKEFFFKDDMLISPSIYFTKSWDNKSSKYFRVFFSAPSLFNDYSLNRLDSFVDAVLNLLNVEQSQKDLLEKEKIDYILCSDENEIKKVSGFQTRGIYILAYDEIITTYNCHFHEIAHLLINFRLKNLPLYTLPFLQEGFATAIGGRGGLGRNVLFDIGWFLQKSTFIPFNSILTKSEFISEDASMTYPVAALYNLFLIEELGIQSYLNLYSTYSGNADFVSDLTLDSIELPSIEKFNLHLTNYQSQGGISLNANEKFNSLSESNTVTIKESENYYQFKIRSNILLKTENSLTKYISKKFSEVLPTTKYEGHKYLIKADSREVNIYNLYTNILIASYSAGFSLDMKEVPSEDGYFIFYVRKDVFEEKIVELIISEI